MSDIEYFQLYPHCHYVRGATHDAIYDIHQGRVFWLHVPAFARAIGLLEFGEDLQRAASSVGIAVDEVRGLTDMLSALDYGAYQPKPAYPEKFRPVNLPGQEENFFLLRPFSHVVIEIHDKCSLDCSLCGLPGLATSHCACGKWAEDRECPRFETSGVIRDLAEYGCREIVVRGGDPFLIPEALCAVVEEVRNSALSVRIHAPASAHLLSHIPYLAEHQVRLSIPVFGFDAPSYEETTGVVGSFAIFREVLERCREHKAIHVSTVIVMTDRLLVHGDEFRRFLEERGIVHIQEEFFLANTVQESPAYFERYRAAFKNSYKDFRVPAEVFLRLARGHRCWQDSLAITRSGVVLPCIAARNHPIGDLRTESVFDILGKERHRAYRDTSNDSFLPCNRCEFRYGCTSCSVATEAYRGSIKQPSWNCLYNPEAGTWSGVDRSSPVPVPSGG